MQFKNIITKWLSRIILKQNILPNHTLLLYRKLERTAIRLASARAHRSFNETCINNNLLPNYTNIYIYIYIYNYIYIYMCVVCVINFNKIDKIAPHADIYFNRDSFL